MEVPDLAKLIQSPRDQFWREVNNRLAELDQPPANNGEIDDVYRRTTCPHQAARFINELRSHAAHPGGPQG